MAEQQFTCKSCLHWQDQNIIGLCRRYPNHANKHFSDWCGEHTAKREIVELPVVVMPNEEPKPKRKYTRRQNVETSA